VHAVSQANDKNSTSLAAWMPSATKHVAAAYGESDWPIYGQPIRPILHDWLAGLLSPGPMHALTVVGLVGCMAAFKPMRAGAV
jgi:hypothetical protein